MADKFGNLGDSVLAPARRSDPVTPSDTVALDPLPKGIYVGTGGTVKFRAVDSPADTIYPNLGDGSYINVRALYIRATGTTASNMSAES